ncbi:MAG: phage baseplate protein [Bacteroidetes bacterium]|nr:MAG: phage baseplate protein [Bacteroidota bacterium]
MQTLSAWELLAAWEQGLAQSPVQRALMLLAAASPGESLDELAGLSIGQRDGRLLTLRAWTFGPKLHSTVVCPACGERLEFSFQAADIYLNPADEPPGKQTAVVDGYTVHFRLPNSRDFMFPEDQSHPNRLFQRCLLAIEHEGKSETPIPDQLPDNILNAVAEHMAAVDPQADVQLNLTCPGCEHSWLALFDILSFFWQEIEAWAYRTLNEVHILASAYGWREVDILTMSAWRRQLYLQMVS